MVLQTHLDCFRRSSCQRHAKKLKLSSQRESILIRSLNHEEHSHCGGVLLLFEMRGTGVASRGIDAGDNESGRNSENAECDRSVPYSRTEHECGEMGRTQHFQNTS